MGMRWIDDEIAGCMKALWESKPYTSEHTKERWNSIAHEWGINDGTDLSREARYKRRVSETVRFLKEHQALREDFDVIDVGCGPGRFVQAFAGTASHVTGTDISPDMLSLAQKRARNHNVFNVSFTDCDFHKTEPRDMGWENRFDLVFSSITPAVSRHEQFEKLNRMSRAYCFNASFMNNTRSLVRAVSHALFNKEPVARWEDSTSYALFNLLWLAGYSPYVSYFSEAYDEQVCATRQSAGRIARCMDIPEENGEEVSRILHYLEQNADPDGILINHHREDYIWLLWDVRQRTDRSGYHRQWRIHE